MQGHHPKTSKALPRYLGFWSEEHSLSVMLALLVVDLFVLAPGGFLSQAFQIISTLFLTLALLAGVLSLERPAFRRTGAVLVAGIVLFRTAHVFAEADWLVVGETLFTLLSLVALILIVYRQVSKDGPVSAHLVRGAIALYLLIAMLFAFFYGLIEILAPGSFNLPTALATGEARGSIFYYFSVVTLTTVGYGDITAVHPVARSLVMCEALIGQLYPAILIARLVTLELETRRNGK